MRRLRIAVPQVYSIPALTNMQCSGPFPPAPPRRSLALLGIVIGIVGALVVCSCGAWLMLNFHHVP